tara:strand:- start:636 stop:1187 length:552 start_codon:yes stop_codon:yes gene_type:complete
MNDFKLFKYIPFLSTLIIIIFLSINNQKEDTKLRILIWKTPSLTLGSYLAISSCSGFILSYIITTGLLKFNQSKSSPELEYKNEIEIDDTNSIANTRNNIFYDNTLIERDIRDPSPTINASFRVIGKTNKKEKKVQNKNNYYDKSNLSEEPEDFNEKYEFNINDEKKINQISNDWSDDTYENW